jgi:replication fork clamp-binding protein CrfC
VQASLKKAIAPTFEIIFAGAFSAGKSMLINALLERELLYSAEGHATGTECKVPYAPAQAERVVLTFLSEAEIWTQIAAVVQQLNPDKVFDSRVPGQSGTHRVQMNHTLSMEQLNFTDLQEAASYARWGVNSAVLKRIEYYCHHPLLQDGNTLIDTPGIDAPVRQDSELTYAKIQEPEISAVVCVLKVASAGDMTTEETELLETMRRNPGIRDRVFYVFNRDESWYNSQLRQRLDQLIHTQFRDSSRVYKTSGLLGFWGSQLRKTGAHDRFGLDSLFANALPNADGQEDTPPFVNEFNRYCASSSKLPVDRFRIDVRSYETPNQNYVRILSEQGPPLIEQLVHDSGIETFRTAIMNYGLCELE